MTDRTVAVVAVHGVGSPPLDATARAVADLLLQQAPEGVVYGPFRASRLVIPAELPGYPVNNRSGGPQRAADSSRPRGLFQRTVRDPLASVVSGFFDDRSLKGSRNRAAPDRAHAFAAGADGPASRGDPDIAFMRSQLHDYVSTGEPCETIVLEGSRTAKDANGKVECDTVHVYEMHWADLTAIGKGWVQVFGTLYQLVMHISHLGRKTLDVAESVMVEPEAKQKWKLYAAAHAWAVRLFSIFVPTATMLMLACILCFLPGAVPDRYAGVAGVALLGIAIVVAAVFAALRDPVAGRGVAAVMIFAAIVAAGIGLLVAFPTGRIAIAGEYLSFVVWSVFVFGLLDWVLKAYDKNRGAARAFGRVMTLVVLGLTARRSDLWWDGASPAVALQHAAFVAFQFSYASLMLTWIVIWLFAIAAIGLGWWAIRGIGDPDARRRAKRAAWTARVTLAGTMLLFILAALAGYWALVKLAVAYHTTFDVFPKDPAPIVSRWIVPPPVPASMPDSTPAMFRRLIASSGTSALSVALAGQALALFVVAWFGVLVAGTSIVVPKPTWTQGPTLGKWFTLGFWWVEVAGNISAISVLLFIVVGAAVDVFVLGFHTDLPQWITVVFDQERTKLIIAAMSVAIIGATLTIAAAHTELLSLAKRLRPAIGLALDVDDYLRESPNAHTPRARIAERFRSLLHYIGSRRRDGGTTPLYDAVVIVSHSQGTVITVDFLRYALTYKLDVGDVQSRQLRLITMGSPLRQLYGQNFPDLYKWVDERKPVAAPTIDGLTPQPGPLGVEQWVNLYTTGDYVGRTLWRGERWPDVWKREGFTAAAQGSKRRERCLGAGTHTRYWTSVDVAEEIDRLIGLRHLVATGAPQFAPRARTGGG